MSWVNIDVSKRIRNALADVTEAAKDVDENRPKPVLDIAKIWTYGAIGLGVVAGAVVIIIIIMRRER